MKRDILLFNETLFAAPEVFDFDYVPEEFLFRGNQMQEIILCVKPAINKRRPINCMLSGPPATGKTTSIKKIFEELKAYKNVIAVCLNSRIYGTSFKVYSEMHKIALGFTPPTSGIPSSELLSRITKKLSEEKKVLIVALDDAVFLEECDAVLYQLLRANETFPGIKIGVIAVLSEKEKYIIQEKSFSVFQPRIIEYEKYNGNEIFEILKIRAKIGFYPGVVSEEILREIAEHTIEFDLRFGIELLRQSALEAEGKSEKKISKEHVDRAFQKILKNKSPRYEIDEKEKIILDILNKKIYNSGELYDLVKRKSKVSYASFHRAIDKLIKKKMIGITEKFDGGRTRIIRKL